MTDPMAQGIGQAGEVVVLASTPDDPIHILAFHGDGGVAGTRDITVPFVQQIIEKPGVTMSLVRYRSLKTDQTSLEDMRTDAARALEWAQAQLPSDGRLYLLGASFGGLLALDTLMEATPEVQGGVEGLILLNAVTDTWPDGFSNRVIQAEDRTRLSPLARFEGHPVLSRLRCFMAHGEQDDVVPIDASHRFAELWPEGRCEMMQFPASGHGFFNHAPLSETVAAAVRRFVSAAPLRPGPVVSRSLLPEGATMVYGIGAQKAGTSWLFDYLSQSHECHTGYFKELHYFDALYVKSEQNHLSDRLAQLRHSVDSLKPGMDAANHRYLRDVQLLAARLSIYAAAPGDHRAYADFMTKGYSAETIICDFTPSYCMLDAEGFREMDGLGPAKFIFILRDPVDRLWSQIRMVTSAQNPELSDDAFEAKCVAHAHELNKNHDIARIPRADYARTMTALEAAVPYDRIHYAFYENLFSQDSVDEICAFLDIAPHEVAEDKRINLGRSTTLPDEVERMLTEGLAPQYEAVRTRFGDSVPETWRVSTVPSPEVEPQTLSGEIVRLADWAAMKPDLNYPPPWRKTGLNRLTDVPVVVFPYIPKTGGQPVLDALKQMVPERVISPVRTYADASADAQMPPGYRLYAGHINWVDLDTLPDDRFAFTVLSDPRERIASFYFYLVHEAAKLSAEELATKARTNMRRVSSVSADDYFFGGGSEWQRFINDHYNNFYCNYLITRKIRGWTDIADLDQPDLVRRALAGAADLQRVYAAGALEELEDDLAQIFGTRPSIQSTGENIKPETGSAAGWPALLDRFERDESAMRLERFVEADVMLMQQLGFET